MAKLSTARLHATAFALVAILAGCSRDEHSAHAPITPALEPEQNPHLTDKAHVLAAELNAAGVATSYEAHFTEGQLTRIAEKRERASGGSAQGQYDFQGARLLRYAGAPVEGHGALTLELDLQGRVVVARLDGRDAAPDEISAIRARAQLLRSHALAQSASRTHAAR